jgi:5-methylcytosine-specific restriction endonuclease McrA
MDLAEARDILRRVGLKACTKCWEIKPFEEFPLHAVTSDGRGSNCKECMRTYYREKARNNEEHRLKLNENAREWHRENRVYATANQRAWRQRNPEAQKAIMDRSSHIRRANLSLVESDRTITLELLYERDEGICQICEEPCPQEHASIDHITAVSKGGSHTWDNVQLAHRLCNSIKGAN